MNINKCQARGVGAWLILYLIILFVILLLILTVLAGVLTFGVVNIPNRAGGSRWDP